jgi:hypothetical protein
VGSHVIGFWAKVEQRVDGGERLYLLSYPKQVEELDLRNSKRMDVMIPTERGLAVEEVGVVGEMRFEGLLVNISDGGCLLCSVCNWSEDLQCVLRFTLPGAVESFVLSGEVVRMGREGDRIGNIGVQFENGAANSGALKELRDWISEKRTYLMC